MQGEVDTNDRSSVLLLFFDSIQALFVACTFIILNSKSWYDKIQSTKDDLEGGCFGREYVVSAAGCRGHI